MSCNRYAGEVITHTAQSLVAVSWPVDWTLSIEVEKAGLWWEVVLTEPPMARVLNAVAAGLPGCAEPVAWFACWARSRGGSSELAPLGLTGSMPNGQVFSMTPCRVWVASGSRATLAGSDLGAPGSLPQQAGSAASVSHSVA